MNTKEHYSESHEATYCPEDNKLRLYVGYVSREEYQALRKEGWKATPKQECDFVASWSVAREDTALGYAGTVLDEDQGPEDRAADRAERFAGYRDKRTGEALGGADRFEAGPAAHGYQSEKKAARAAARHDRIAARAVNAWDKADYWTRRTAGVISSALYKSTPGVRMGRIKKLESEQRKADKAQAERVTRWDFWSLVNEQGQEAGFAKIFKKSPETPEQIKAACENIAGSVKYSGGYGYSYKHPRPETCSDYAKHNETSLYSLLTDSEDPLTLQECAALYVSNVQNPHDLNRRYSNHLKNRLAYERQMLEAQGGRAEMLDIELAGTLGGRLILKVNKSNATGRASSVQVLAPRVEGDTWAMRANFPGDNGSAATIDLERVSPDAYEPPTVETKALLKAHRAAVRAATPKKPSLLNPTDEDAQRLQDLWNAQRPDEDAQEVKRMTQAEYKAASSGGNYATHETTMVTEGGREKSTAYNAKNTPDACKVRKAPGVKQAKGYGWTYTDRVVILTDKPQKPLPASVWTDPRLALVEKWSARPAEILEAIREAKNNYSTSNTDLQEMTLAGLVSIRSLSQISLTDAGRAVVDAWRESEKQGQTTAAPAANS